MKSGLCHGGPLDGKHVGYKGDYMASRWTIEKDSRPLSKQGEEINNMRCKEHTYIKRWHRLENWEWYEWH